MNFWQLARCALGRHNRDRRRAQFDGDVFRSVCTGCGRPMVKLAHGWIVDRGSVGAAEAGTRDS